MIRQILSLALLSTLLLSVQHSYASENKTHLFRRVVAAGVGLCSGGFAYHRGAEAAKILAREGHRTFSFFANSGAAAAAGTIAVLSAIYVINGDLNSIHLIPLGQIGTGSGFIAYAIRDFVKSPSYSPGDLAIQGGCTLLGAALVGRGGWNIYKKESKIIY